MDSLINRINTLQDLCASTQIENNLDLPQIVVIGSQSSGKTSVLENIVGVDFLPRGAGIVTRRPLILQLIYVKDLEKEYCQFIHQQDKKYTDMEVVKREILDETNRHIKSRNDVSSDPITLKFYSSNVLNLTLVDLPGLIKVPTCDQPKNICTRIEEMCRGFVENKNAIILAVSAANTDISNSDALHLAKEVDPKFERTIGVLTKLDLMDSGTDAVDILAGKIVKLRLGFVPIINRSQSDIQSKKSIKAALSNEKQFFENHPSYKKNKLYCGTEYLVQRLSMILHEQIKLCLPNLMSQVDKQLHELRNELKNISMELSPKEFIFKTINDVSKKFTEVLQGRSEISSTELSGGARLNYTFHHHFSEFIARLEALDGVKDEQIRTLLYNSSGSSSTLLFAHVAFEKLAKQSVALLKPHSQKLVTIVFNEIVKIIHKICTELNLNRFPVLNDKIISSLVSLFKENSDLAQRMVGSFIDWNIEYINTKNPDFLAWKDMPVSKTSNDTKETMVEKITKITFDPIPTTIKMGKNMSESELAEVNLIKNLVRKYFEVIKKIVVDQVPKAIMTDLVIKSEREIHNLLFKDVYEAEGIIETIKESEEIRERKVVVQNSIAILVKAQEILCSI